MSAPVITLTPCEFIPRAWAPFDASDALSFWLLNPLLLHHYPVRMAATAEAAAQLTSNDEKLHLVWRLREMRWMCRARKPAPVGLPESSWDEMHDATDLIPDATDRAAVRQFGHRHPGCELPWVVARIHTVLAAHAAHLLTDIPKPSL